MKTSGAKKRRPYLRKWIRTGLFMFAFAVFVSILIAKISDLKAEALAIEAQKQVVLEQIDEQKSLQLEAMRQNAIYGTDKYLELKARDSYNMIHKGDIIIVLK